MRTYIHPIAVDDSDNGSPAKMNIPFIFALSILFLIGLSTSTVAQRTEINVNIDPPTWAPFYENTNLVRYYYLPDIECYYDVRSHEFIYLEDGQWMFGHSLPPAYAWFDLNNCFIVALNVQVFEPWRHFHYYVAHYPRYYYRSYYHDIYKDHSRPLRGFNENEREVVYNRHSDAGNNSYNNNENRQRNESRQGYPERRVTATHSPEPMIYYGKHVGKPVKVEKHMKESHGSGNGRQHHNREK